MKKSYKIPQPLGMSKFDKQIAIVSNRDLGIYPVKVRTILIIVFSVVAYFIIIMFSILSGASFLTKLVFTLGYIILACLFTMEDATGLAGYERLFAVPHYISKQYKEVYTRKHNDASGMVNILNSPAELDDGEAINRNNGNEEYFITDDGVVKFKGSMKGYAVFYEITGSASQLLFDDDKEDIIDAVDNFYRKFDGIYQFGIQTSKSAQKTNVQVNYMRIKKNRLKVQRLTELEKMAQSNIDTLERVAKIHNAIHQYGFVTASNLEQLQAGMGLVESEAAKSDLVFKRARRLSRDETIEAMAGVYK